jgi:hypothetical protein
VTEVWGQINPPLQGFQQIGILKPLLANHEFTCQIIFCAASRSSSSLPSRRKSSALHACARRGSAAAAYSTCVFRKSHRACDRRAGDARWVWNLAFQSAVSHLRVFEHLAVVVDRPARDTSGLELRDPLPARAPTEYLAQQRNPRGAVRDAPRHGSVARIGSKPRPAATC